MEKELIELEFYGYEFALCGIPIRTSWLPMGRELDCMKEFAQYLVQVGCLDDS